MDCPDRVTPSHAKLAIIDLVEVKGKRQKAKGEKALTFNL
jgi:hypothetical protein